MRRRSGRHGIRRRAYVPKRKAQAGWLRCVFADSVRQMNDARRATLPALAKINLDLRVIGRREDGYHELRTIFQTISLADSIDLSFQAARRTSIALEDPLAIPDNLVARAARFALREMRVAGRVEIRLKKRIPM